MAKSLEFKTNVNAESLSVEQLITDHIDIWTSAIEQKSSAGRGTSNKFSLYGIKKLRELILELAVRGKLVPQDSNDEPASVLLERIAAEKAQLVKEGKHKKQKPLPEISDDEKPFELPQGWAYERIGIFGIVGTGSTPSRSNPAYWEPPEINWVSSGETSDFFVAQTKEKVSNLAIKETNVSIYPTGTLIVAMYGQGKTRGQITELLEPAGTNQACAAISLVDKSVSHKNYVKLFFRKSYLELRKHAAGGAQPNLNVGKIASTVVSIPPLEEQHRIVAKVDELMLLCDALEAQTEASISAHQTLVETLLNALLLPNTTQQATTNTSNTLADSLEPAFDNSDANSPEPSLAKSFDKAWLRIAEHFDTLFTTAASIDTLKQTILQLAVMGKLVPQNVNDEPAAKLLERIAKEKAQLITDGKIKKQKPLPAITDEEKSFELPQGWEWCRIGDISKLMSGKGFKKSEYSESGARLFQIANVSLGYTKWDIENFMPLNYLDDYPELELKTGDVLIALNRPLLGKSMKVCILSGSDMPAILYQRVGKFEFSGNTINTKFFYYFMQSPLFIDHLYENLQGSDQPFINISQLIMFRFPLPALKEQERIVAKVDKFMALCDQLKARLADAQITQLHLTDAIVEQAV